MRHHHDGGEEVIAVLVAVGAALGAVLRFVVDSEVTGRTPRSWPVATFLINVTGSLTLGALTGAHVPHALGAFAVTGVCGGFTTFSTASVETLTMMRARRLGAALAYAGGSLLACVAAVALGNLLVTAASA